MQDNDLPSSGDPGLVGFTIADLAPGESQARGFHHRHSKRYGIPQLRERDVLKIFTDPEISKETIARLLEDLRRALISCASSLQYDASALPARQMGQMVRPEKFTRKQRIQSRLDGGEEIDGSRRAHLPVTEEEDLGHIAREKLRASAQREVPRNSYKEVELTGCHLSLLPHYRQRHCFQRFTPLDEFGMHQRGMDTSDDVACIDVCKPAMTAVDAFSTLDTSRSCIQSTHLRFLASLRTTMCKLLENSSKMKIFLSYTFIVSFASILHGIVVQPVAHVGRVTTDLRL